MRGMVLLASVALSVGAGFALPGTAGGQAPDMDSVTSAPFSSFCQEPDGDPHCFAGFISIDVQSGPLGENPTGPVTIHFGGSLGPTYAGTVTCLAVHGNQAVVGFAGTVSSSSGFPPPQPFAAALRITDVASPDPHLDAIGFQTLPSPAPTDCSAIPPPTEFVQTVYGDIVVHDAPPPVPASKDQCKDGGWQAFGFKNQGECVAFVERGPKP